MENEEVLEMEVRGRVRKIGTEMEIIVPEKLLEELELKEGQIVEVAITKEEKIDGFGIFSGAKPFQEEKEHSALW